MKMKRKTKNSLVLLTSFFAVAAFAAACAKSGAEKTEYNYEYHAPLRAKCDSFMQIDGKLDEEIWKDQKYLYWVGGKANESKATTVFTSKGLYVGMYTEDKNVVWANRYSMSENSRFRVQVVKDDEINYNDRREYIHPTRQFVFDIDAKDTLSRMERRYDAAGYCDGELNGESNYFSAELFLPWSEMGYTEEELGETGMPGAVKLLIQYWTNTGYSGFPGFSDDNSFKTYYTYDKNGSTCTVDRYSGTDTVGYSVGGWTPGDKWEVNEEEKTAKNTVNRTQILWLRKDVYGQAKSGGTHYIAGVKIKAEEGAGSSPFAGLITLCSKTVFNIYGAWTNELLRGNAMVLSVHETDGSQWVASQGFGYVYNKKYAGETTDDGKELAADEVYLSVAKRGSDLYYFVNGNFVGMEYDERVSGECVAGIFANGKIEVSDWNIEDYSSKQGALDEYLNKYVYFLESSDNGGGYVSMDKIVARHGEAVNIRITPKPGYALSALTVDGEDKYDDFLANADADANYSYVPTKNMKLIATFEKIKSGLQRVYFEVKDADKENVKLSAAKYVIRGSDKRLVYSGSVNKGNITGSLLKAGSYTFGGRECIFDGKYTAEISCDDYVTKTFEFEIPADYSGNEYSGIFALREYPFGAVKVNGKTTETKGKYNYKFSDSQPNDFVSEADFKGWSIKYLKNTVMKGDYVFNGEIALEEDALFPADDPENMWKCGALTGFALTSGRNRVELKSAAWIAGKLYLNYNGGTEIGLTGFPVENDSGNSGFYKSNARLSYTVAKYNGAIYVFNKDGVLGFVLGKNGIELVNSVIAEGEKNLEAFNKGIAAFFKDGDENAFGLYTMRNGEGGGTYRYSYAVTQNASDISKVFEKACVRLKSGEQYGYTASGKYTVDDGFIAKTNVTLRFTGIPATAENRILAIQYENGEAARFFGNYDKAARTFEITLPLNGNAEVWLEAYDFGAAAVNGGTTYAPSGSPLTKNADGSHTNTFGETNWFTQYYTNKTAAGDYLLNATVTVAKTPQTVNGWQTGSGAGFALSAGGDKSVRLFTNSWEGTNLLLFSGKTFISVSGFPRDNSLKTEGSKFNFKLIRKGNTLYFYNVNELPVFHITGDEILLDAEDAKINGTDVAKEIVLGAIKDMLEAGNETAFGVYFEYAAKSSYAWKADVATDENIVNEAKYMYEHKMTTSGSVSLNGTTVTADNNAAAYNPLTKTYTSTVNQKVGFVNDTETKRPIVVTSDYIVRLKMRADSGQTDFRIYASDKYYLTIRSGVNNDKAGIFVDFNSRWASEITIGGNTEVFLNGDCYNNGTLELTIVRHNNVIYVYGCDYLDSDGNVKKTETWKLLFSFGNKTTVEPANGLTKTLLNDKTYGEAVLKEETGHFYNAGTENAFAVRNHNGAAGNWIVKVNDDDAAAAAFVANPPAVD